MFVLFCPFQVLCTAVVKHRTFSMLFEWFLSSFSIFDFELIFKQFSEESYSEIFIQFSWSPVLFCFLKHTAQWRLRISFYQFSKICYKSIYYTCDASAHISEFSIELVEFSDQFLRQKMFYLLSWTLPNAQRKWYYSTL